MRKVEGKNDKVESVRPKISLSIICLYFFEIFYEFFIPKSLAAHRIVLRSEVNKGKTNMRRAQISLRCI